MLLAFPYTEKPILEGVEICASRFKAKASTTALFLFRFPV